METSSLLDSPTEPTALPGMSTISDLLSKATWLAGHSLPGDITELVMHRVPLREEWVRGERILDSLLLARMHDENDLSYSLENLLLSRVTAEPWKHKTESYDWVKERNENGRMARRHSVDARRWPVSLRKDRCARDAWAARVLVEKLYDKRKAALVEYTHKTAMVLERVRLAGAAVDMEKFDALDLELYQKVTETNDRLCKLAAMAGNRLVDKPYSGISGSFSPTNDGHIRELLFNRLGLEEMGTTKTGKARVDKAILKQLSGLDDTGTVSTLLQCNQLDKLYRVNVRGVRELTSIPLAGYNTGVVQRVPRQSALGYLPFRINPLGARTGRRSSTAPNSQNWPESVRGLVKSRWVDGRIINADYQKLEVVLIAWVAGDDKLLSAFTGGKGYIDVAKELFNAVVEAGTPQYTAVKSIVLGVHYNMQTPKMAANLWLIYDGKTNTYPCRFSSDYEEHEQETDRLRKLYLKRFAGIGRYMEAREAAWLRTGVSTSYTGRIRHLPVPARGEKGYGHSLNQAINFPIQSLASDVTASALIDFESAVLHDTGLTYLEYHQLLADNRKKVLDKGFGSWYNTPSVIINEVHDSLVVDLHPDRIKRDTEILIESMRSAKSLRRLAPGFDHTILGVDCKTDTHWRSK